MMKTRAADSFHMRDTKMAWLCILAVDEMLVEPPPVSDIDNLGGLVAQTGETLDAMLVAISIDDDS